jgi:hypothetical protein
MDVLRLMIDKYPESIAVACHFRRQTPLHLACQVNAPLEVIKLVYCKEAAQMAATFQNSTPLHIAFSQQASPEVLEFLMERYESREFGYLGGCLPARIETFEALGRGLAKNTHVKSIQLVHVNLGSHGVEAILKHLRCNETIRQLDLSGNDFEPQDPMCSQSVSKALHDILSVNVTLQVLSLRDNRLNPDWLLALKENPSLVTLDITGCKLGPILTILLQTVLQTNTTLRRLHIGGNRIGNDGILHMLRRLQTNKSLVEVDFHRDQVNEEILSMAIVTLKDYNTSLRRVGFTWPRHFTPFQAIIEYYCNLNASGRAMTRNPATSKEEFLALLLSTSHGEQGRMNNNKKDMESIYYGLLRELPHLWLASTSC